MNKQYFEELTKKGFKPRLNIMDNQATKHIKKFLTENDCKVDDEKNQDEPYDDDLGVGSRSYFVASQGAYNLKETLNILVKNVLFVLVKETMKTSGVRVVKVTSVDELILDLDDNKPNASEEMDVKNEHENEPQDVHLLTQVRG